MCDLDDGTSWAACRPMMGIHLALTGYSYAAQQYCITMASPIVFVAVIIGRFGGCNHWSFFVAVIVGPFCGCNHWPFFVAVIIGPFCGCNHWPFLWL